MEFEDDATLVVDQTSQPYVGRWQRLVSTTNWEKGRIIYEWRSALMDSAAPATDYSDEAWSRLVGGVTGQHAGRLRRVYDRFGAVYTDYEGLYWSHFQATLDWEDAEMWLEGAIQNKWSVSKMRQQRWETMGAKGEQPRSEDIVATEIDEDFATVDGVVSEAPSDHGTQTEVMREGTADAFDDEPRSPAGPDFGDEDDVPRSEPLEGLDDSQLPSATEPTVRPETVRPFADLPPLPEDLMLAMESFQVALLRHKANNWGDVALTTVLAHLDALKLLVQG